MNSQSANYYTNMNPIIFFKAERLGVISSIVPLSVTIFYAEPRHKRIFTAIGAKKEHFAFFMNSQKKNLNHSQSFQTLKLIVLIEFRLYKKITTKKNSKFLKS